LLAPVHVWRKLAPLRLLRTGIRVTLRIWADPRGASDPYPRRRSCSADRSCCCWRSVFCSGCRASAPSP